MIEIRNLTKIFEGAEGSVVALEDVNLTIEDQDIFGIIGMSGAGKSTLLRCLCMLEQPTRGEIILDGQAMTGLSGAARRAANRQMGVVFQGYHLLEQRNVAQNVAFPLRLEKRGKAEIAARVEELLALVGLSDKARAYPSQLSGGQKQRVAIARALATNPKVLLCDEPTSALDSLTTQSILKTLKEINRSLGVTIIVITHEIAAVRAICNKVAVIDASHFVETGSADAVLDHPQSGITRQLLGKEVAIGG